MYRVLLERAAEKDLARFSSKIHDRVIAPSQALAANPRPPGCRKLAGSKNDWRIRVGDYRVVYEIADTMRVARVNRVRHRREVYHCVGRNESELGSITGRWHRHRMITRTPTPSSRHDEEIRRII